MATTGFIYEPDDGTCPAHIVDGEKVFDATGEGLRRIGSIDNAGNVYSLRGEFIGSLGAAGHFEDDKALEAFRKLLRQ